MDSGKNFALAGTLSKFFLAKDETWPLLECKFVLKTDVHNAQINNLQHSRLFVDCQKNHCEVDLLRSI